MKAFLNKNILQLEPSGIRSFNDLCNSIEGCLSFTIGEPEFDTPSRIKDAAKKALDENKTHYPAGIGLLPLRQKISKFEKELRNLDYSSDEIIITLGASEALAAVFYGILNEGDEVIIPQPAYVSYRPIIEYAKGKVVELDTQKNQFQISEEMLEQAITPQTKCLLLTSPNNPTGCIYNEETLASIAKVIKGKPIFVVCDDVYNQIIFQDKLKTMAEFQEIRSQIIVVQSFSKPYAMTGWRIGYVMAEKSIIQQLVKLHQFMVSGIPTFCQYAAIEALDCDVSDLVQSYHTRRDYIYNRLVSMGLEVVKPEGAFYIFPSIAKYKMSSYDFCLKLAQSHKVAFVPGIYFGQSVDGFVRISYACSMEYIVEGMNRLEAFLQTL